MAGVADVTGSTSARAAAPALPKSPPRFTHNLDYNIFANRFYGDDYLLARLRTRHRAMEGCYAAVERPKNGVRYYLNVSSEGTVGSVDGESNPLTNCMARALEGLPLGKPGPDGRGRPWFDVMVRP